MGYYGRNIPNQMVGVFSNPTEGLNEYLAPMNIRDNQFSYAVDVLPYRDSAVKFYAPSSLTPRFEKDNGHIVCSISTLDVNKAEAIFCLHADTSATPTLAGYISRDVGGTKTEETVTSLGWPTASFYTFEYSACTFNTEADKYVVFSVSDSSLKKLIYYNITDDAVGSVVVPFTPKRIITHANRIFAIDTGNKIWWSKAGSFINAADWYGSAPSSSYVSADSGYWTVEKEISLQDIAVLGNTLFVFGLQNIHAFTGYDYDTFAMQIAVPDLGLTPANAYQKTLVQNGSAIYFLYKTADGADIYEFNGTDYPTVINRQIMVAGQITNGILGSIDITSHDRLSLSCDENYLYVYPANYNNTLGEHHFISVFYIKSRTWWRRTGFSLDGTYDYWSMIIVPTSNRNESKCVVSQRESETGYDTSKWSTYNDVGYTDVSNANDIEYPHIVTKCFSNSPTDKQTLTSVVLQIQAAENADLEINLYASLTADGNDFEAVREIDSYIANGAIEEIEIFMPLRYVARASRYRLKVEIKGAACYLYNIERRYRVTGRSR